MVILLSKQGKTGREKLAHALDTTQSRWVKSGRRAVEGEGGWESDRLAIYTHESTHLLSALHEIVHFA